MNTLTGRLVILGMKATIVAFTLAVFIVIVTGCSGFSPPDGASPMRGRAAISAYDPAKFGDWTDLNGDGCDTREDVLERSAERPIDDDRDGCKDDAAVVDRYTRQAIVVSVTDIDHVVSKKDAWESGASLWADSDRALFMNDMENLFATHRSVNRSKGDQDAAEWKTSVMNYGPAVRCEYATAYKQTKEKYSLTITVLQHHALKEICDGV